MEQLVALLRGINLGRNRRIAMAELREALTELGFEDVRTQGQSGNVVLRSDDPPDAVARAIEEGIRARFGMDVDAVVRTAGELAAIVDANPLADVADDGAKQMVVFLSAPPDPDVLRDLEQRDLAPEEWRAAGRELHVWCPGGIQKSPTLAALYASRATPGGTATARNWNTVAKLRAMVDDDRS